MVRGAAAVGGGGEEADEGRAHTNESVVSFHLMGIVALG